MRSFSLYRKYRVTLKVKVMISIEHGQSAELSLCSSIGDTVLR